jgi:hypothetical protein
VNGGSAQGFAVPGAANYFPVYNKGQVYGLRNAKSDEYQKAEADGASPVELTVGSALTIDSQDEE